MTPFERINDVRRQPLKTKKIVKINQDTFCSIWISNHEGELRKRYKKMQAVNMEVVGKKDAVSFEEFAVHIFETVPMAIEHNMN